MNTQTTKRTHFPRTTASQRKLLFQTWQATGDVQLACRKAHVSERTYYNWKPRFEKGRYQALEEFASHAPKTAHRTPHEIELRVIELKKRHPKWGKRRIADEMAKANNWVPLVSPNTVRRILSDAGLWERIQTESRAKKPAQARTADKPEQTLNIDLSQREASHCFVPATHEVASKLPAVSGSSGRLVVERTLDQVAKEEPTWPGRVFEQQELTYEQAMDAFVYASANKQELPSTAKSLEALAAAAVLEQKRQLRQEEEALRVQRRVIRIQRKLEDQAWSAIREQRRAQQVTPPVAPVYAQTAPVTQQTTQPAQQTTQPAQQATQPAQQATQPTQQTTSVKSVCTPSVISAAQQAISSVVLASQPVVEGRGHVALTSQQVQQATSVAQQATSAVRQIASVSKPALSVREPAAPVREPAAPVREPAAPVREPAALVAQPAAEVRELAAEVRELAAPVREPAAEVREPAAPVREPVAEVREPAVKEETKDASKRDKRYISDGEWRQIKSAHRAEKEQRKKEDIEWRQKRNSILQRLGELPFTTAWVAILVIVDNCTRQCLGLPLFMVGPHVTAQMIVDALREVLPTELQYLISDRGVHFRANIFTQFCQMSGFQHVLIAKHRPQSNGIAERFVRTFKEWLADKSWTSEEELIALLTEFREYYNDRPHQGIAMPGLSPNEYAKRIWVQ